MSAIRITGAGRFPRRQYDVQDKLGGMGQREIAGRLVVLSRKTIVANVHGTSHPEHQIYLYGEEPDTLDYIAQALVK